MPAFMIPKVEDTSLIRPLSEKAVYEALRDQLPGDYVIFHSFPWLRRWRGDADKALLEGEADFVLLHPKRGLLVLEVKGGEIYTESWKWKRLEESGPKDIQNPFTQARRNMHALLEIIEEWAKDNGAALRLKGKDADFTYGYAVVFPDMNYKKGTPPDADKAMILSHRHLSNLEEAISVAYRAWEDQPRPLSQEKFNVLYGSLTARPVFVRPVGAEIAASRDKLLLLTETQSAAYQALLRGRPRVLVQGPAGSGKTELAFTRAAELARAGQRVLLTCYNKELAYWLRERASSDEALSSASGTLKISHFHELAASLAKRAELSWEPEESKDFWTERVYNLITTAVARLEERGETIRYDAVLLDEAQDFYEMWWWALAEELLVKRDDAPIYAFMDPNQKLRAEASVPSAFGLDAPVIISENCRNTQKIATLGARTVDIAPSFFKLAPVGTQARVTWAKSAIAQRPAVEEEVQRLIELHSIQPSQIALISPSKRHGSLAKVEALAGVPLTRSAEEWRAGGGAMLATTAKSFKGLEADVVVLYDVDGLNKYFTQEDLYVSCTRARFHLSIVIHRDRELYSRLTRWAQ